ncbi:hypothetical protein ACFUNF_40270 [Streptomyces sp. NPDC057291]|uniref:hypothetical protein n=1 Tax=Streptomyces sp. NPDC057291 TaxID=3346087 RepID=UPI003624EE06
MSYEKDFQADQTVGSYIPVRHTTATVLQPVPPGPLAAPLLAAPDLTLYPVPVPGAVPVVLPDGRTAWGKPVEPRLEVIPSAGAPREAMPGWAKAVCAVAGSLTLMALGSAIALRIAAPALGGLVDLLEMVWKVTLTLAVIFFGFGLVGRYLLSTAGPSAAESPGQSAQPMVFAPRINTGGNRLIGRGGDVNIQVGDRNRNKQ